MLLLDVHTHLDHEQFKNDLDQVVQRSQKAGLKIVVSNGTDIESNRAVLALSQKYEIVKAALGLYPLEIIKLTEEEIQQEADFIKKQKNNIVAIGEIGLDLHWDKDPGHFSRQKEAFLQFIELGEQIKKPLIVHSRDAEEETLSMLESSKVKNVDLHCFGGNMKLVKKGEDLGYYFSIPPSVVFSKHFQEIVGRVNINQLLTETDAPYLAPVKGQRNEPCNVLETVKKIAEIKGFTVEEVANNIWMNWDRIKGYD